MGTLSVPSSGLVYLDANCIIFTVEKHPAYGPLLEPLWQAAQVERVDSVVKVGDKLLVKVIAIDDQDRVKLSQKALLRDQQKGQQPKEGAGQGPRRDH